MQEKNNSPKRYNTHPFPAYRYIPTQTPHPVIDPKGHSFGKEEEKVDYIVPEEWKKNSLYLYGIDLFNFGFWWEAHEAWETLWLKTKKFNLEGQFLQGLIQMSAALLKLYQGNTKSFFKLFEESSKRLHFCITELNKTNTEKFMGISLKKWLSEITYFKENIRLKQFISRDAIEDELFPFLLPN
ncbi:MAG: DUF309 domain-containing protein [Deltaproteobacteria bacterium]|nr:DUF309 domain-containing protein [Deltaproteobacteria bacterium]